MPSANSTSIASTWSRYETTPDFPLRSVYGFILQHCCWTMLSRAETSDEACIEERAQHALRFRGDLIEILECILVHVVELRELELHGFDVLAGLAVVPRDVAALEAAVDDVRVLACRREHAFEPRLQCRRAARAARRAEIEIGQLSFEQER